MIDGIEDGAAPNRVVTDKEKEARRAFESGDSAFMRIRPLGNREDRTIKDEFKVAPLPALVEANEPACWVSATS
jgi:hypothetical protein